MEVSENYGEVTSQESEVYDGEITLEINGQEDKAMLEDLNQHNSSVEYKDESVIATQNFPLSSNKPLGKRIKNSIEYVKWSLTRYSNSNDSAFSNLKRNIWCNLKQFFLFLHFKLTEKADVTPQKRKFNFIDVYKSVEEDPHLPHQHEENSKQKNYCLKIIQYALLEQTWLLLILLGMFCAFSAILLEFSLSSLEKGISWLDEWMIANFVFTGNVFVRLLVDIVIKLILCSIAGLVVRYVSPQAAGSGLPEMKSILSGVVLPRYLSFRTYLAKFVGLLFGIAGGLSIGMEGPFVHLSAIIANQLSKFKIFERIRKNEALRFQMLSAGCAVGISTVFGAPIGGVLFAIEKTTTYVLVQNIWKALFAATVGAMIAKLGGDRGLFAMFATSFPSNPYKLWELLPHALIGIIFGYLGGMWVRFVLKCVLVRRDYKILSETRYSQLLIIATLTAIVAFPFAAFQLGDNEVISTLFSTSTSDISIWNESMNIYFTLILFIAYKFVFTGISLGLPVPCGLYIPVFLIGAAGGRLIGEFLLFLFPSSGIIPGGYAVVGAAAMSSGVTRTLSTSIIVFEMTGQLELLIPVLIATILGTAVGNLFSDGIYETLLEQKRLPYMPPFGHLLLPDNMKNAAEMMKKDVIPLDQKATFNQVYNLIDNYNFTSYPVVNSSEEMILCGEVSRKALVSILESRDMLFANDIEKSFLKHFHQSSTKDQMIKHLKNRYKFASQKTDSNDIEEDDDDDDDYSMVEEDLFQKRFEFFNVPILDELEKLSNSDYDRSPFQVTEGTHFFKIHFMFSMLGLNHAYITRNGSLVGVITKKDFLTKTRSFIVWR